ncbi:MAG: hypothetical protein WA820_28515, partial [Bradyrhizobium sp.]
LMGFLANSSHAMAGWRSHRVALPRLATHYTNESAVFVNQFTKVSSSNQPKLDRDRSETVALQRGEHGAR